MAKGLIDDSILHDIGDAIREKNSSSETYLPSEMAEAIQNIEAGMLLPTLDNPGSASDLAEGKQLIGADGSVVEGVVKTYDTQVGWSNRVPSVDGADSVKLSIATQEPYLFRNGFFLKSPFSNFGNATADKVAKGATFTSVAGFLAEGTVEVIPDETYFSTSGWGFNNNKKELSSSYYPSQDIILQKDKEYGFITPLSSGIFGNATVNDVPKGVTFTSENGCKLEGNVETGSKLYNEGMDGVTAEYDDMAVGYKYTFAKDRLFRKGDTVQLWYGSLGDATPEDVRAGVTFTSRKGVRIEGTATASATNVNCASVSSLVMYAPNYAGGTTLGKTWQYADQVSKSDNGNIALVNPKTITVTNVSGCGTLRGKYITSNNGSNIYYVSKNATFTTNSGTVTTITTSNAYEVVDIIV